MSRAVKTPGQDSRPEDELEAFRTEVCGGGGFIHPQMVGEAPTANPRLPWSGNSSGRPAGGVREPDRCG